MGSLVLKWWLEVPRRRFKTFLLDTSKQIFGSGWLHCLNMIFAITAHNLVSADECAWYWINLMVDCSLGLVIVYSLLSTSEKLFGYESGLYSISKDDQHWEENVDFTRWAAQILGYLLILTVKKLSVTLLLLVLLPYSASLAETCTHWVSNPRIRLFWVMVLTPLVMDTFSYWVSDNFLKYHHPPGERAEMATAYGT